MVICIFEQKITQNELLTHMMTTYIKNNGHILYILWRTVEDYIEIDVGNNFENLKNRRLILPIYAVIWNIYIFSD